MIRFYYLFSPLLCLVGLIAIACVISYEILYWAGDILALDKLISKATEIFLILSIFPLKKQLKLSWGDLGFARWSIFFKQFGWGLCLSLITLLPVLLVLYWLDVHVIDISREWTLSKVVSKLSVAFLLALLIALAEEVVFRGVLLSVLKQKFQVSVAIVISAFYYAILHFLKSKSVIPYAEIKLTSGFDLMLEALANCFNPAIISALISLCIVGVFLGVLRVSGGQNIGLCVGCHCGWVWQIKASKDLCNVNPQSTYQFLISNYDGVVGSLVSVWLSIAIVIYLTIRYRLDRFGKLGLK